MPVAQTQILWTISVLQAMRGDFEGARDSFRRSADIERTLGRELYSNHFTTQVAAAIEELAGAFDEQARILREGLDRWETLFGEVNPMLASMLAQALIELGDAPSAQSYVDAARGSGEATHPHIEHLWQEAQARIFAQQGRYEEAEQAARRAVEILRPMEFTWQVANSHMTLAIVLNSRGSQEEAQEAMGEALARYQSKGIHPCIERATQLLERWNG
jgi:tetratricopeptide (TPR) repeat protein